MNAFYRVAFRKKRYRSIEALQVDLDLWISADSHQRPHQGRRFYGKTPMQTFFHSEEIAKEKMRPAA